MSKKRKRFMKLELLETSAVGTPAYADAHFSLFKSLSSAYQDLKGGEEKMAEEEITGEEEKAPETPVEAVETPVEAVEADVAVAVEDKVEETEAPVEETEERSTKWLISTLQEVITKMPVERALVETKSSMADAVKGASLGELFLAMTSQK